MSTRMPFSAIALFVAAVISPPAGATSSTSSSVTNFSVSPPTVTDLGTTSSSATILGAQASGSIDEATGAMHGLVSATDPLGAFVAETHLDHSDSWDCSGGATCQGYNGGANITIPIDFHFTIEGVQTGGGYWTIDASYATSFGASFQFHVYVDGPNSFNAGATLNGNPLAVAVVGTYDNLSFSVDSGQILVAPGSGDPAYFTDEQTMDLLVEPFSGGTSTLDASHTFKVTLVSQDPQALLNSADGRYALPVPEPSGSLLMGAGIAVVALCRRRPQAEAINQSSTSQRR